MQGNDWVPIVAAVIGGGGVGALFREIVAGISKLAGGMSARESKRKVDIVQQRDAAIAREERARRSEDQAWRQVDREAMKRRAVLDYAARLRRRLIELGETPEPEPTFEHTITKAELRKLRDGDPS